MSNELEYALHFTYKFSRKLKHIFNGSQKTFRKHAETLVILMNIQGQASDCSIPISGNTHQDFLRDFGKRIFFLCRAVFLLCCSERPHMGHRRCWKQRELTWRFREQNWQGNNTQIKKCNNSITKLLQAWMEQHSECCRLRNPHGELHLRTAITLTFPS